MSDMEDQSQQPQTSTASAGGDTTPSADERQWGMFAHLAGLLGFVLPFGNLIGPLVVWQLKKADMPFVDEQGKEALNFQITVAIAVAVCLLLSLILIGFLLLPVVGIGAIVLTVMAGLKANQGESYRYPFAWRLIT